MITNLKFLIIILLFLFGSNSYGQSDSVLTEAEQMPYFPGCFSEKEGSDEKRNCSNQKLIKFISNTLTYPTKAKENGIEGTVILSFVVNEKGLIEAPKVIKDIGGECANAALQVLEEMPRWEPGKQEGKSVKVQLKLPLTFSLQTGQNAIAQKHSIDWGLLRGQQITKSDIKANMDKAVIVRDELGNTMPISQLTIAYERGKRYLDASSNGKITTKIQKILKQVKRGGELMLQATVHDKGDFVEVERTFRIE